LLIWPRAPPNTCSDQANGSRASMKPGRFDQFHSRECFRHAMTLHKCRTRDPKRGTSKPTGAVG
jgi:hypothetical protein